MSGMLRRPARDLSMELRSGRHERDVTEKHASKPLSIQGAASVAVGKCVALASLAVNQDTTNANVSLPRRTREMET